MLCHADQFVIISIQKDEKHRKQRFELPMQFVLFGQDFVWCDSNAIEITKPLMIGGQVNKFYWTLFTQFAFKYSWRTLYAPNNNNNIY